MTEAINQNQDQVKEDSIEEIAEISVEEIVENLQPKEGTPHIWAAKVEAMRILGGLGIGKNAKVEHGRTKFKCRSIDDALQAYNQALSTANIALSIETVESDLQRLVDPEHNRNGDVIGQKVTYLLSLKLQFTLVSAFDGSKDVGSLFGAVTGSDVGKLSGILSSYLFKEFMFKSLITPVEGADDMETFEADKEKKRQAGTSSNVAEAPNSRRSSRTTPSTNKAEANGAGIEWIDPVSAGVKSAKAFKKWAQTMLPGLRDEEWSELAASAIADKSGSKAASMKELVRTRWQSA